MTQKVILHPNMAPFFLLLQVITNETLKLKPIDWLLVASKIFLQKYIPTILVFIPVVIYTLGASLE